MGIVLLPPVLVWTKDPCPKNCFLSSYGMGMSTAGVSRFFSQRTIALRSQLFSLIVSRNVHYLSIDEHNIHGPIVCIVSNADWLSLFGCASVSPSCEVLLPFAVHDGEHLVGTLLHFLQNAILRILADLKKHLSAFAKRTIHMFRSSRTCRNPQAPTAACFLELCILWPFDHRRVPQFADELQAKLRCV